MGTLKFRVILESPLRLPRERTYRDIDGRIYFPGSSLKGMVRKSLAALVNAGKARAGIEDELMGKLFANEAKAAAFSISAALTDGPLETEPFSRVHIERETGTAKEGGPYVGELVPEGTVFTGVVHSRIPEKSSEDMALRLALLSIRNVGVGASQEWGACKIELSDEHTRTEQLYDIASAKISPLQTEAARLWIPNLENELLLHFARNPEEMRSMPPRRFEELVAALFKKEGFIVELTPESWDGGYDILAIRHDRLTGNETFLVECKRYAERRRVGIDVIRNLMGVIQFENATKGIIATTAFFSAEAQRRAAAASTRLVLHDYHFLKNWLDNVALR